MKEENELVTFSNVTFGRMNQGLELKLSNCLRPQERSLLHYPACASVSGGKVISVDVHIFYMCIHISKMSIVSISGIE